LPRRHAPNKKELPPPGSANRSPQRTVGEALERPDFDAMDAVLDLIQTPGRPYRLRDVGMTHTHIETISQEAKHNLPVRSNPRSIDRTEPVREILKMAW
jgi:alcohol dehydrogenase class IV